MQSLRALRRAPGFSAAAIAAIALGTGAATLVFAVLYSVVLRPLPYRDPSRLVFIWIHDTKRNIQQEGVAYPTFLDWQARNKSFESIAARMRPLALKLTGAETERVFVDLVSANFFDVLGCGPAQGRLFTADEENRGDLVVVISDRLAKRRFGSAAAAPGQPLEIDQRIWRVIGVMPPGFGIIPVQQDLWLPARKYPPFAKFFERRDGDAFMGIARLKPGVTPEAARADLNAIGAQLALDYPISDPGFGGYATNVVPFARQILGERLPQSLWIALAAVGLVLLVACVNVANLLLARAVSRQSEFAIRSALGAPIGTLISLHLTEAALLAAAGGTIGLLLAWLGTQVLPLLAPANLPRLGDLSIHPATVLFTITASAASAVIFAAAPGWIQSRKNPASALSASSTRLTDRATGRIQPALVIAEFAFALLLIAGAGLFLRTLAAITSIDPGFETNGTVLVQVNAPEGKAATTFFRTLLDRLRQLPRVDAAGAIGDFFIERNPDYSVTVQGRPTITGEQVTVDPVTADFLPAVRARLIKGRFLDDSDYVPQGPPATVVINETFARRFFPNEDAIGKHLKFGTEEERGPWITVVGVVADLHRQGRERGAVCEAFGPIIGSNMDIVVRTSARAEDAIPAIRGAIREIDPNAFASGAATLDQKLADYAADRRLQAWMIGSLSILTLFLAAVGVYGVMQYVVFERRRELAIRMATGATPGQIWWSILSRGLAQAFAGIAAGLVLFAIAQRFLASLLYGISPFDPISLATAVAVLAFTGCIACLVPASLAARTDPASLLRDNP